MQNENHGDGGNNGNQVSASSSSEQTKSEGGKKRMKGTQAANIQQAKERLPFPRFGEKLDQRAIISKEELDLRINERKESLYTLLQQERSKRE